MAWKFHAIIPGSAHFQKKKTHVKYPIFKIIIKCH